MLIYIYNNEQYTLILLHACPSRISDDTSHISSDVLALLLPRFHSFTFITVFLKVVRLAFTWVGRKKAAVEFSTFSTVGEEKSISNDGVACIYWSQFREVLGFEKLLDRKLLIPLPLFP